MQTGKGTGRSRCYGFLTHLTFGQANINNGANLNVPVVQTVTSLVSTATNAVNLAKMGELFLPWF